MDTGDQHKSPIINKFIREHFTSLRESGQLSELFLKNFTDIIEHDEINVKNKDMIFSSKIQIINQQTSVDDISRCLELIRYPHTSGNVLVKVILKHPLMEEPPRDKYDYDYDYWRTLAGRAVIPLLFLTISILVGKIAGIKLL